MKSREPCGTIGIARERFEIAPLIQAAKDRSTGAIATFVGVVRDDGIESITIEAYEEVAEKDLHEIRDEAVSRFDLVEVTILHRIGILAVGDDILLIVVSAGHRKQAFSGCEYILERIKERVPIWKEENLGNGNRWVRGNNE